MRKHTFLIVPCLVAQVFLSAIGYCGAAESLNQTSAIAPFVSDDTFFVAHLDLASLKPFESSNPIFSLLSMISGQPQVGQQIASIVNDSLKQVQDAGVQSIDLAVGLSDLYDGGGPVLVVSPRSGTRLEDMGRKLDESGRAAFGDPAKAIFRPLIEHLEVYPKGDVLLVGTKSTLNRYTAYRTSPRTDLIAPLDKLLSDGAMAAAVFCPGPDFRRVVRELWPTMPGSLAPLNAGLADRWQHVELALKASPEVKPHIALEARDHDAAEVFAKLWRGLPTEVTEFDGNASDKAKVSGLAQMLVGNIAAKVDGTRVTIEIPDSISDAMKLGGLFGEMVNKSRESSQQVARMSQFKQIALAMFIYEDKNKHFPPAAIRDKEGKPLLSWRVAILPFIQQEALYKQFHLDEPWDSPHNRQLVAKMPELYAGPDSQGKQLAGEGKTTYQVPVGPQTVFYKNDGTSVKEITDGTSHTILLVEVEPSRAVVWTKPEDWEVDMEHPRRRVAREDRRMFTEARCDGSVRAEPIDIDENMLRALLTRAGNEKVEQ